MWQTFPLCVSILKYGGSDDLLKGYGVGSSVDAHESTTRSPAVWPLFEGSGAMLLHLLEILEDTLAERGKERCRKKTEEGMYVYM